MVNYSTQWFPINVNSFQNWAMQDIGSTSQTLWNGMSEYEYVSDGYIDGGNLPLKLEITATDPTEYVVSAAEFKMGRNNGAGVVEPEAIVSEGSVFGSGYNTGFRWTAENSPTAMPLYNGVDTIVDRIEFWDTAEPGTVGNKVLVYAWLKPGANVGGSDMDIVLDIDGDAFLNTNLDNAFYVSLTADMNQIGLPWNNDPIYLTGDTPEVPESGESTGGTSLIMFTIQTQFVPEGTTVSWKAIGDISINDVQGNGFSTLNNSACDPSLIADLPGYAQGQVTISAWEGVNGVANTSFWIEICEDNIFEGPEYMTLQLQPLDSNGTPTQELTATVLITDATQPYPGCTNPIALNYDPLANVACNEVLNASIISGEVNWDTDGVYTDGDTVTITDQSVWDNLQPVENPNWPELGLQTGPNCCCQYGLEGCTDPDACNYDPNAVIDNGTCFDANYGYDCDGNCLEDSDGDGICDPFEPPPGVAKPPCIHGCTDENALNYNPAANCGCPNLVYAHGLEQGYMLNNSNYDFPAMKLSYGFLEDTNNPAGVSNYEWLANRVMDWITQTGSSWYPFANTTGDIWNSLPYDATTDEGYVPPGENCPCNWGYGCSWTEFDSPDEGNIYGGWYAPSVEDGGFGNLNGEIVGGFNSCWNVKFCGCDVYVPEGDSLMDIIEYNGSNLGYFQNVGGSGAMGDNALSNSFWNNGFGEQFVANCFAENAMYGPSPGSQNQFRIADSWYFLQGVGGSYRWNGCVYPQPYNPCEIYTCGCMDPMAVNYDPAAEYQPGGTIQGPSGTNWSPPGDNPCQYAPTSSTFYYISDFSGTYGDDLTFLPNMEFPYYDGGEITPGPVEGPIPPNDFGPPYATKYNKLSGNTDIHYIRGQINYSGVQAEGETVYSKRSKAGGIGYGVQLSTADWWDGIPGVQKIWQSSFYTNLDNLADYGINQTIVPVSGSDNVFDTLNWVSLGDSWNGSGGFYIRPKQGYTVSRHNFYVDCERIRFSSTYSAQAAADHYTGNGKRMCCGSKPKSIMQSHGTNSSEYFNWTEGLGGWDPETQQYETEIPQEMMDSISGPCCEPWQSTSSISEPGIGAYYDEQLNGLSNGTWQLSTVNTWKSGLANLDVSLNEFYVGGSPTRKENPRLKVQKTEYINPWVYIRPAGWNGTFVNSTGGTFPIGPGGTFPDNDMEPLPRYKLDANGHPDQEWAANNTPDSYDNIANWAEHPVNNVFAAIEIWDMQPLNTWEWCENVYYDNNLPEDLPFGVNGVLNDFIDGNCCTWENPQIHNLRFFGVEANYFIDNNPNNQLLDGNMVFHPQAGYPYPGYSDNWLPLTPIEDTQDYIDNYQGTGYTIPEPFAYTGCNLGDLPYFDRSYICPAGDWFWMFQEGGGVGNADWPQFIDMMGQQNPGQMYLEKSKYCAPPNVLPDAGVNCSGYTNYGWNVNGYAGSLPSCGGMNTDAELNNNPTSYFYDKFKEGVDSGIINPGNYIGNYLYIKAVRKAEFGGAACEDFKPQSNFPPPKEGTRFYFKIKGEPMVCNEGSCEQSQEIFVEINDID